MNRFVREKWREKTGAPLGIRTREPLTLINTPRRSPVWENNAIVNCSVSSLPKPIISKRHQYMMAHCGHREEPPAPYTTRPSPNLTSRPSTLHTGNVFQHYLCFSICYSSEGFQCYPKFTRILYVCLWLIAKISMKYYTFSLSHHCEIEPGYVESNLEWPNSSSKLKN